ncbi:LOW QUALITY PROTEIN: interferon lambda-4-like [Manis pentadactyla]|uniref:LOW QUALITY PROTEIN: interferon lambda-4-like n=1 Tax=Manis pentadactyla TaxID=143292 RepID=UPI00255CBC48|nr:LOW QUALITY PROTEIN: interferon lambda-4-like [Manis pentadactyla]
MAAQLFLRPRRDPPGPRCAWRERGARGRPCVTPARSPQSCARLRLVARAIADAQAVLSSLRRPELFPGTGPTLELLAAAGRHVAACLELGRPGSSRRPPPAPRRRPKPRRAVSAAGGRAVRLRAGAWAAAPGCEPRLGALRARRGVCARGKSWLSPPRLLPEFQDSPRCREATVVFNLLRLLRGT